MVGAIGQQRCLNFMSHETSKAHLGCIVSVPKVVAVHNVVARRRGLSSARQEERFSPISTRRRLTFVKLLSDEGRGLPLFHPSTSLQQFADAEYMPMQAREQQPQSTVRPASGLTYMCYTCSVFAVSMQVVQQLLADHEAEPCPVHRLRDRLPGRC